MPEQGSFQSFGLYPDMDETEHLTLSKGIPLFQLVYPKPLNFERSIFGMFDVKVDSPDPDIRNSQAKVEWYTGGDAHLTFAIKNKKGLAMAWMPDDPWMHNRIELMNHPKTLAMVKQMRLPNGAIRSAAEIQFDIETMKMILKQPVKIWHVARNGNNECYFFQETEAQAYREDQGRTEVKYDEKTGTLKPSKVRKDQYTVVPGERWVWKPEIEKMIMGQRNKNRFGWTDCNEFKQKWRPQIIQAIKDRQDSFSTENESLDARTAVSEIENLPEEVIEAIARRIAAKQKAKRTPAKVLEEEVAQ